MERKNEARRRQASVVKILDFFVWRSEEVRREREGGKRKETERRR